MTGDQGGATARSGAGSREGGRRGILVLAALCLVLMAADFLYERHPYFRFQELPGINIMAGIVGSALVIGLGRLLLRVLGRDEDYYHE